MVLRKIESNPTYTVQIDNQVQDIVSTTNTSTDVQVFNQTQNDKFVPEKTNIFSNKKVEKLKAALFDIEGTTTPTSFVFDTLFPYAQANMGAFLKNHQNEDVVSKLIQDVKSEAKKRDTNFDLDANLDQVIDILNTWMKDPKLKITPLKELQGLVWEEGYKEGLYQGELYKDAYLQMTEWNKEGLPLYIYSSGSERGQELLFENSNYGNVEKIISGHFDTKVGGKMDAKSYKTIAEKIGVTANKILFFSDTPAELKAAKEAGMQPLLVSRDGKVASDNPYPVVSSFDKVQINKIQKIDLAAYGDPAAKFRLYTLDASFKPVSGYETSDNKAISEKLKKVGIRFEQWPIKLPITALTPIEDIKVIYKEYIDKLVEEYKFTYYDVAHVYSPNEEKRQMFLEEHKHGEDEVRYFANGSGPFYLHIGNELYIVRCEAGDLISVPANTTHWFDIGKKPNFTALRFFLNKDEGWKPEYTSSTISETLTSN